MRHRLSGPSTYGLNGLCQEGDEPTAPFTFPYLSNTNYH